MLNKSDRTNLKELMEKHYSLVTEFLKHIVMVASGILAVFVSLMDETSDNSFLFRSTLLLLLSSILLGTIALYLQVVQLRILRKDYTESLKVKYLEHDLKKGSSIVSTKFEKLSLWLEYLVVVSFLLGISSLVGSSII